MNEHNLLGKVSGGNPSPILISPNALMAITIIKQSIFSEFTGLEFRNYCRS
jgi:hypothetical protein